MASDEQVEAAAKAGAIAQRGVTAHVNERDRAFARAALSATPDYPNLKHQVRGYAEEARSVEAVLAEALGYTHEEEYGWNVGDHTTVTLAKEAASALRSRVLPSATPSQEDVEAFLRGHGLTDEPEKYHSNIHSWRCEHPDRYGRCTCFTDFATAIIALFENGAQHD